jgi:hypothetical protein
MKCTANLQMKQMDLVELRYATATGASLISIGGTWRSWIEPESTLMNIRMANICMKSLQISS